MDEIIDQELVEPQKALPRVYSLHEIVGGSFLGGALAGAFFLSHNFRVFGDEQKSTYTWIFSILYLIILVVSVYTIPFLDKIPNMAFTAAVTGAFYGAVHHYQSDLIDDYIINKKGTTQSWLKTIGISVLMMLITLGLLIGGAYLLDPSMSYSSKNYGELDHELSYNASNIDDNEADNIAGGLTFSGYFGDDQQSFAFLDEEDETYIITLSLIKDAYKESDVVNYYELVQDDISSFTNLDIEIRLVEESIDNVKLVID